MGTFAHWDVPHDFAEPIYNYLVYGFMPGSCFTAFLANDAKAMLLHSHPVNTIQSFKNLAAWLEAVCPHTAHGSYENVQSWIRLISSQRRAILEDMDLIYTEQEEIVMVLKGDRTVEPFFWDKA